MSKEQSNFRIDSDAKESAYKIFEQIGIRPTDAVNMFINYVAMFKTLPFKPSVPNAKTKKALKESAKKSKKYRNFKSIRKELKL